jgi:prepilin-type N-terminal cleavage/methylation domain-containing protein
MRRRRGLSIVEVMVALLIFGVIFAGAVGLFAAFEKENGNLNKRIQAATLEFNLLLALKSNELVRELLSIPENYRIVNCLRNGCDPGTTDKVILNPSIDWAFRGFDFDAKFIQQGQDLIELNILLKAREGWNDRTIKVFLPRRDYLHLPLSFPRLNCSINQYLNGVQFDSWRAICETL